MQNTGGEIRSLKGREMYLSLAISGKVKKKIRIQIDPDVIMF